MSRAGWLTVGHIPALIAFTTLLGVFLSLAVERAVTFLRGLSASGLAKALWGSAALMFPGMLSLTLAPAGTTWRIALVPPYLVLPGFLLGRPRLPLRLTWEDAVALLLIWLPPDLGLLPGPLAKLLAVDWTLFLFLIVRRLDGVGYRYVLGVRSLIVAAANAIVFGAIAVPLGLLSGFLSPASAHASWIELLFRAVGVYFAVAVPEEILFRGVILNLLQRGFPRRGPTVPLLLSAGLFGLAHWKERDWRYMLLAALAGIFYGGTYLRTGSVVCSGITHALVDFVWGLFFRTLWSPRG